MGRKKIAIKPTEENRIRRVTFTKRRNGLFKEARKLSMLCDVDIGIIISSGSGKFYQFCSTDSLADILNKYRLHIEKDSESRQVEHAQWASYTDLLQTIEMKIYGEDAKKPSIEDLHKLENQLGESLARIKDEKLKWILDSLKVLQQNENELIKEQEHLLRKIEAMETSINACPSHCIQPDLHLHSAQESTQDLLNSLAKE